jgi:primosomal protein N'
MARSRALKPGDKVAVPWGLDEIVGLVLEVYGPPGHKNVFVRVPVHGPSGETLDEEDISFPANAVRAVATT